jgi:Domain of unknown function (DUF5753)
VKARMALHGLQKRKEPPEIWVLLAEAALPGPGKNVQLGKLLEYSELPNVILRVVPNSAGANLGLETAPSKS